jgi:glycerophosphoryl diester phosphodiesterase
MKELAMSQVRRRRSAVRTSTVVGLATYALLCTISCADTTVESAHFSRILEEFLDEQSETVLVVAHRGDWRRAPENSLSGIRSSISQGVDIVEVDVAMTSDGHLVLMHDQTVDRTTNGTGSVSEMTLSEIRQLRLLMADGSLTDERVPTLREALRTAKGKCMLDLDRGFLHFAEVHRLLVEEGMLNQSILKSSEPPVAAAALVDGLSPTPLYMPTLVDFPSIDRGAGSVDDVLPLIQQFLDLMRPEAFALMLEEDDSPLLSQEATALIRSHGARIFINTLWNGRLSGGFSDELATESPEEAWGPLIDRGVTIIQTDEANLLLEYLRSRQLHW